MALVARETPVDRLAWTGQGDCIEPRYPTKGPCVRVARVLPVLFLLLAATASSAGASTEIGQLGPPFEAAQCSGVANVQVKVESGTIPYAVPAGGGVITAWRT